MRAGFVLVFTVAIGLLAGAGLQGAEAPEKITTVEGITEYQYDNGLRLLLFPDKSTSRVTVNMTVLVGSRHEGYGETGMAHLLEHMLFKGTPTHPDIPKVLRDHGATFNGTTWVDRTNYFESMNASEKNLEFAIRLEADRLVNSLIRREDLASEMTVVRNEFEQGENSATGILSQRMMATAYEWHNYGKSTIGNRSDIERVPVENLREFYRKFYQPDNVVLIIAGNFDPSKAIDYTTKYFGSMAKPKRKLSTTYTEEPAQDGERTVVLRRVGKVGAVGAVYHIPAAAHPDFAALSVLVDILDSQPSGRLYEALVKSKLATQVVSYAMAWHDPGVVEVLVQMDKANGIEKVRNTMIEVLENLDKKPFTKLEVDRAKRKALKQRELLMNNVNRIGIVLSDWAAKGDWRLFFLHRDRLEKVTPADVQRVAATYLRPSNRTVGMYIPTEKKQRTTVPSTPNLAKLLDGYKGREAVAAGESFDPTPFNIEKRVQRTKLPSGIKVALLPKKTRGEMVVVNLTLRFGNDLSLQGKVTAAEFLGSMMRRGTKDHNRQEIEDQLDNLKATLGVGSDAGSVDVSIRCQRDKLPAVLTLLGKILREPTFPEKEFEILKRQQLEGLKQNLTEPTALGSRALSRKLRPYPPSDVRYLPTIEEEIELVEGTTLDQIKKIYKEQLNGQNGELVVVGDFAPATVLKSMGDILKDWKSTVQYRRIGRQADPTVKAERIVINTPDKANAMFMAGHTLAMKDSHPDYPALEVANYLFGGAPLASRLSNRVRGKEGLSYGVASMSSAGALDPYGVFMMYAISNPDNSLKVDQAIQEELQKLLKDGITAEELEQGKKAYLQRLKNGRGRDSALAGQLGSGLHVDRTFAWQAGHEQKIANLTVEQVNTAIRKHWNPKRLVIVRAGDFSKSGSR